MFERDSGWRGLFVFLLELTSSLIDSWKTFTQWPGAGEDPGDILTGTGVVEAVYRLLATCAGKVFNLAFFVPVNGVTVFYEQAKTVSGEFFPMYGK